MRIFGIHILTDEQLREMQADYYSRGYQDCSKEYFTNGFKEGVREKNGYFKYICNRILSELNELQRNTWDQDRIKRIKEMIDA